MRNKLMLAAAAAAAFALSPAPQAQAQSLTGSEVTVGAYCCSAPVAADLVSNTLTRVVGTDVEFPEGSFTATAGGQAFPVDIDVSGSTITLTYSAGGVAESGGYNGFVFDFDGAPTITGASLDSSGSNYSPIVTFDATHVFINEAGLTLAPGSSVLVNISAVPEPQAYALMVGGLGLLGVMARRRRA
jgi:hypothetical protein